jgi:hypothetical protein
MDKKVAEKLESSFCEVLYEYAEKGFQNPQQVETAKAALSGLVKIKMLDEMERFRGGNSFRSYDDEGMSNRRDSMGRYADDGQSNRSYRMYRDDGYSGHDMMSRLEEMRGQARNEDERRMIDEIMKRMK